MHILGKIPTEDIANFAKSLRLAIKRMPRKTLLKFLLVFIFIIIWHMPLKPCIEKVFLLRNDRELHQAETNCSTNSLRYPPEATPEKLSFVFKQNETIYRDFFQANKQYKPVSVNTKREYINPLKALIDQYNWTGGFKHELDKLKKHYVDPKPTIKYGYKIRNSRINRVRLPQVPPVPNVDCAKLFENDPVELIRTEILERQMVDNGFVSDQLYYWECEVMMLDRGYVTKTVTEEEANFPIAYSIMMYKTVAQIERLLRAIYRPQNYYCIHIDKKARSDIHILMQKVVKCFNNVFIASRSLEVTWGETSVIEAELICMRDLWEESLNGRKKWKYFINLTGQEFPLKTNWELVQILKSYKGGNDIGATISNHWDFRRKCFYNIHGAQPQCLKKKGPPPYNYTFGKGPVHVAVSRDFVDFCLHNKVALELINWLNGTLIPDEAFFQTLFLSYHLGVPGSYLGAPCENRREVHPMVRFKKWDWWRPCRGGNAQRHICLMTIWDLPELAVRPEMFVNKFEIKRHPLAYSCLEQLHINKTREDIVLASAAKLDAKNPPRGFVSKDHLYSKIPWIRERR